MESPSVIPFNNYQTRKVHLGLTAAIVAQVHSTLYAYLVCDLATCRRSPKRELVHSMPFLSCTGVDYLCSDCLPLQRTKSLRLLATAQYAFYEYHCAYFTELPQ